jgi:hypothetical protein
LVGLSRSYHSASKGFQYGGIVAEDRRQSRNRGHIAS